MQLFNQVSTKADYVKLSVKGCSEDNLQYKTVKHLFSRSV
jgi:hypothetical protein